MRGNLRSAKHLALVWPKSDLEVPTLPEKRVYNRPGAIGGRSRRARHLPRRRDYDLCALLLSIFGVVYTIRRKEHDNARLPGFAHPGLPIARLAHVTCFLIVIGLEKGEAAAAQGAECKRSQA
jgi:hypothetical protein